MVDYSEKFKWAASYGLFTEVINSRQLEIGVEVGVASGGHAESILMNSNVRLLYGVDPYENRNDYVNDIMNLPQKEFEELYQYTVKRMSPFGSRFKLLRKYSKDAVVEIPSNVDFVYIDADHSYDGIRGDLCSWFPKVNDGGVIGGHDYQHPSFPGVTQAVHEFFGRFGWAIHHPGEHVWWVEKQPLYISFFMPAYNCAETVRDSVESIMAGNFTEGDELVIADDGSTDDSAKVLVELKEKYKNINIVSHFSNRGGGAARNTAIEACRHSILFCLDSDNLLVPGSVAELKRSFENNGADVASFQELHYFQKETNKIDYKWKFKAGWLTIDDHLSNLMVPGASGNYMFTKSSWAKAGGYPEVVLDTWGFGMRQIFTGAKMYVMPNSFYFHRYGHESYWMRSADGKERAVCLMALQVLLPFSDMLDEKSLDYIMSRKGRYTWFHNLHKHPLQLARKRNKIRVWDAEKKNTPHYLSKNMYRIKHATISIMTKLILTCKGHPKS